MMNLPQNCEIFRTRDGSPTLMWTNGDGYAEKMHHSGGALSESVFIYHSALTEVIRRGWTPRILSLGLGLGYNEILSIAEFVKLGVTDWKIWSFESQNELRRSFELWLENADGELPRLYEEVAQMVCTRLEVSPEKVKSRLHEGLRSRQLELRGSFPAEAAGLQAVNAVFYDAYSKKMNPELWIESEMTSTFHEILDSRCLLTTYAATGALNRVLKTLGFRLIHRPGFEGKRESTLAIRE